MTRLEQRFVVHYKVFTDRVDILSAWKLRVIISMRRDEFSSETDSECKLTNIKDSVGVFSVLKHHKWLILLLLSVLLDNWAYLKCLEWNVGYRWSSGRRVCCSADCMMQAACLQAERKTRSNHQRRAWGRILTPNACSLSHPPVIGSSETHVQSRIVGRPKRAVQWTFAAKVNGSAANIPAPYILSLKRESIAKLADFHFPQKPAQSGPFGSCQQNKRTVRLSERKEPSGHVQTESKSCVQEKKTPPPPSPLL